MRGFIPNRIIKESIWLSETLAKVSFEAASHFLWLLPLPDDFGCCHLTASVVKGRLYPLRPEITEKMVTKWHAELEKVDLIRCWSQNGHTFAYFPTWSKHQRIRSCFQRKTVEPPSTVVTRCQLPSNDSYNPNPNPNPSDLPKGKSQPPAERLMFSQFSQFWKAYPRDQRIGTDAAKSVWRKIKPDDSLVQKILAALELHKKSEKWTKGIIPSPAKWLSEGRWQDEVKLSWEHQTYDQGPDETSNDDTF